MKVLMNGLSIQRTVDSPIIVLHVCFLRNIMLLSVLNQKFSETQSTVSSSQEHQTLRVTRCPKSMECANNSCHIIRSHLERGVPAAVIALSLITLSGTRPLLPARPHPQHTPPPPPPHPLPLLPLLWPESQGTTPL